MVKYTSIEYDYLFEALSHVTRRKIIRLLIKDTHQSSGELAQQLKLSLPALHKHISMLKRAGIVRREKLGRVTLIVYKLQTINQAISYLRRLQRYHSEDFHY